MKILDNIMSPPLYTSYDISETRFLDMYTYHTYTTIVLLLDNYNQEIKSLPDILQFTRIQRKTPFMK